MERNEAKLANLKLGIETKNKFDFYIVGLIFTILGFSIQSSSNLLSAYPAILVIESTAWIALFVAGVAGLRRIEYIPVLYSAKARLIDDKDDQEAAAIKEKEERIGRVLYRIQRYAFLVGLISLIVARISIRAV